MAAPRGGEAEPVPAQTPWSEEAVAARAGLVSAARRVVRDRIEAEDVADEAIARLTAALAAGEAIDSVAGWLHRVALRVACDRARAWMRRQRDGWRRDASRRSAAPDPSRSLDDVETRERLWRAVLELPDRQRDSLVLRQMDGRSYREVAELLGISEGTARGHVHAARAALRETLWDLTPERSGPVESDG